MHKAETGNPNDRPTGPLLVASGNPHKVEEIAAIFAPLGLSVLGLDDLVRAGCGPFPEPDEPGATFEENARIKAIAYAAMTGRIALADDSGLEVDALGGAPGVHSAYFAGRDGTRAERDRRNNELLVARLRGVPPERRAARFVCTMCCATPDGRVLAETRGEFPGIVVDEPRGTNGFGYDPHLWLPEEGRTSAELSSEEKNARSHRGRAAVRMAEALRRLAT
jgi:XTP/dITP diphosphohydrolase